MSITEYNASRKLELLAHNLRLEAGANPFYSLLMATMRAADSDNTAKLMSVFPDTFEELRARYNAPGGLLIYDTPDQIIGNRDNEENDDDDEEEDYEGDDYDGDVEFDENYD